MNLDPLVRHNLWKLVPGWEEFIVRRNDPDGKKKQLLDMARRGEPRPNWKTKMGQALNMYIIKSKDGYDAEFDAEIRKLAPQWFVTFSKKKQQLLNMARHGDPRPKQRSLLGKVLRCTNKNSRDYDAEFDAEIRRLAPQWFVSQTDAANEKKQQLLDMARRGEEKPEFKSAMGAALHRYTNKNKESYDAEFDAEIRRLAPQWFVSQTDAANEKKQQLLDMARRGEAKPAFRTALGAALHRYTNKNKESYDAEFDAEIRRLAPQWFVSQTDAANEKKQQLLDMARRGEAKPESRTVLGGALVHYTRKDSGSYDAEFDVEIRKLAPQWFVAPKDQLKHQLIDLALRKEPRPKPNTVLWSALHRYTNKNSTTYDSFFDAKIRKLVPHWFKS